MKQLLKSLKQKGIKQNILKAIEKIDRKDFVPKSLKNRSYNDYPLSIGYKQTISQPYTVAFMLQEAELNPGQKVLEIGTGSGWNAALISYLIKPGKVYTIEIIKELKTEAEKRLKKYKNIKVLQGNALKISKKYAPYDRIIITAAASEIPSTLKAQLKEEGILLSPVGIYTQQMIKLKKKKRKFEKQTLGEFIFVPLIEK